jgi:hypothetical protein
VQQRERSPSVVERRATDDHEPERLIEANRGVVLLVDVDGEIAATQCLGVGHQPAAASLPAPGRLQEERRDVITREAHEADRLVSRLRQHPQLERVVIERRLDERAAARRCRPR